MAIKYRQELGRPLTYAEGDENFRTLEDSIEKTLAEYPTLTAAMADDIPDGVVFIVNDGDDAGYWRRDSSLPEGAEFLRRHHSNKDLWSILGANSVEFTSVNASIASGGDRVLIPSQSTSILIPVEPGKKYRFYRGIQTNRFQYGFLPSYPEMDMSLLGGVAVVPDGEAFIATAPPGAEYMIVYLNNVNEGEYPGDKYFSAVSVHDDSIIFPLGDVDVRTYLGIDSVPYEMLSISIHSNGSQVQPSSAAKSLVFEVEPGKNYTITRKVPTNRFRYVFLETYPSDVTPVIGGNPTGDELGSKISFTAPEEAVYAVVYVHLDSPEYDAPGIEEFSVVEVNDEPIRDREERMYLFGSFNHIYKSPEMEDVSVSTGGDFKLRHSTITDIYAEWDNLMAEYPNIISKNLLGYGGDENGLEDQNLPIYEYVIETLQDKSDVDRPSAKPITPAPKILIVTGVHGDEKSTVWSSLKFFEQLLSDKENTALLSIRSNINFRIIPIMNPGGYNIHTRYLLNGVDLNRSFSTGSNEAQIETVIAQDWMVSNSDALMLIDYHNLKYNNGGMSYLASLNKGIDDIYSSTLRVLSDMWKRDYTGYGNNEVEGFINELYIGLLYADGYEAGIERSVLLEVAKDYGTDVIDRWYDSRAIESGVDLLCNFIMAMLDDYVKGSIVS